MGLKEQVKEENLNKTKNQDLSDCSKRKEKGLNIKPNQVNTSILRTFSRTKSISHNPKGTLDI